MKEFDEILMEEFDDDFEFFREECIKIAKKNKKNKRIKDVYVAS